MIYFRLNLILILILIFLLSLNMKWFIVIHSSKKVKVNWWSIQSVDTMKQSRDLASEKLNDTNFNSQISQQVKAIADTGANYIAIDTPYDEKFLPYLKRWVKASRENNLKVWFRGNF